MEIFLILAALGVLGIIVRMFYKTINRRFLRGKNASN